MKRRIVLALAAALLAGGGSTRAERPQVMVVAVRFLVTERATERLVHAVARPLQNALMELPGVTELNSAVSHGYVQVKAHFQGSAAEKDVATVSRRIEELVLDSEIVVTSREVRLVPPRTRW